MSSACLLIIFELPDRSFSSLPFDFAGKMDANADKSDFELWSPSEERKEACLFGRQVSQKKTNLVDLVDASTNTHARLPSPILLRLSTPVESVTLTATSVKLSFNLRVSSRIALVLHSTLNGELRDPLACRSKKR